MEAEEWPEAMPRRSTGGSDCASSRSRRSTSQRLVLCLRSLAEPLPLTPSSPDQQQDPYILRNHLGGLECRLCLTLHTNEGSYLAHTQGKKHQTNLARRAAKDNYDPTGFAAQQALQAQVQKM